MPGRWKREPEVGTRLWTEDLDLEVEIISTAPRDGAQAMKIAEEHQTRCDDIMMEKGIEHVVDCFEAGIRIFDIGSAIDSKHARTTSNLIKWLIEAKKVIRKRFGAKAEAELNFQLLILNDVNDNFNFLERARELHEAGVLDSLAYVHSHDHRFLGKNHIRRIKKEKIAPKDTTLEDLIPILDERKDDILEESLARKDRLTAFAKTLGVPLNIYYSNATGSIENPIKGPEDIEKVVATMMEIRSKLLPESRIIVSDTEAMGNPKIADELMTKLVEATENEDPISEIGIHLHVRNAAEPKEVIELVRAFIKPLIGKVKKVFLEVGFANLGGCISIDVLNKNLPCNIALEALKNMDGVHIKELNDDKLAATDKHVTAWANELKPLAPAA
ncbi:hypothetical protein HOG48_01390 [Candidatus Peregrinibacteria bacterium]|nr:hypothetical protein [Candidatus Peregrinibacteria bacterium]